MRNGDYSIIGPGFLIFCAVAVIGFWPAMAWHGYGGPTGTAWRWDIHSTVACCIWWGVTVIPFLVIVAARKARGFPYRKRPVQASCGAAEAPGTATAVPPDPPRCRHLDAVPVDLSTGERVAWWCEDCQTQLAAGFGRVARPCCGTLPGPWHLYNCAHGRK